MIVNNFKNWFKVKPGLVSTYFKQPGPALPRLTEPAVFSDLATQYFTMYS